jgi:hypothetical protein
VYFFIDIKSITELKFSSSPIGIYRTIGLTFSLSLTLSMVASREAPERSILFIKASLGILNLLLYSHTISLCV